MRDRAKERGVWDVTCPFCVLIPTCTKCKMTTNSIKGQRILVIIIRRKGGFLQVKKH